MKRREFFHAFGFGTLAACTAAQSSDTARPDAAMRFINRKTGAHPFRATPVGRRPHMFVITLDMVSPDHYHPSRSLHREMELPTIRSLMREGVFFSNAFCASPLCAPARAALATGRYTYITANPTFATQSHFAG